MIRKTAKRGKAETKKRNEGVSIALACFLLGPTEARELISKFFWSWGDLTGAGRGVSRFPPAPGWKERGGVVAGIWLDSQPDA